MSSPRLAGRFDSTHTCLNNPENCQTSRPDSPEPSIDKRPTEESRKGREAVARYTDWQEGARVVEGGPSGKAEPPSLACKSRGAGRSEF